MSVSERCTSRETETETTHRQTQTQTQTQTQIQTQIQTRRERQRFIITYNSTENLERKSFEKTPTNQGILLLLQGHAQINTTAGEEEKYAREGKKMRWVTHTHHHPCPPLLHHSTATLKP